MIYLASSRASKEDEARRIQQRDGVRTGLIAIMSCVEPCRRWCMRGNQASKKLELSIEWGKCIHLYFYWIHEELGFLHLRLQTWFPFLIQVCVNGREWLGRQMDKAGIALSARGELFSMDSRYRASPRVDGAAAGDGLAEGVGGAGQAMSPAARKAENFKIDVAFIVQGRLSDAR